MRVCLGILVRNEADAIGQLLHDLANQSLLRESPLSVEVHVVANGCTDRTADLARQIFASPPFAKLGVNASVHEIARAGKSNAWNKFVHEIVPEATDYVIFLDGDIRLPAANSLWLMLDTLASAPNAVVAVDRSVKDIELEAPKRLAEKLIKLATGTANDPRTAIAGACYCARFGEVRKIWMPIGLPGEDGYLRAMLLTSSFEQPEKLERLVFVDDAYHVFESIRDLRGVVRHNVRLAIGTAVNILLFGHIRELRSAGVDIADYIRTRNASDPSWVNGLMLERLQTSYFPLELRFVSRRLRRLRDSPSRRSAKSWAVALLGAGFDLVVFLKATRLMRSGVGVGYW